jgi:hypothetical protein
MEKTTGLGNASETRAESAGPCTRATQIELLVLPNNDSISS